MSASYICLKYSDALAQRSVTSAELDFATSHASVQAKPRQGLPLTLVVSDCRMDMKMRVNMDDALMTATSSMLGRHRIWP